MRRWFNRTSVGRRNSGASDRSTDEHLIGFRDFPRARQNAYRLRTATDADKRPVTCECLDEHPVASGSEVVKFATVGTTRPALKKA